MTREGGDGGSPTTGRIIGRKLMKSRVWVGAF